MPNTCAVPQEIQPPGSEGANPGADGLADASGDTPEGNRDLAHLGKEAGSLEAEGLSPAEQSSTASGAAPAPSAAAPGDKVGDETTTEHRETAGDNVEWGNGAPGQLPEATEDSQAWGSSKELLPAGQGARPPGLPPAKGAPQSKPETKTSPEAQSLQAGKEPRQKGNNSTGKVSVSELW